MENIRDQITVSSSEVAPSIDTPTIEAPATVPTVNTDVDPLTDVKSEQVTLETKPAETVQSQTDETPEVKDNVTKEDRQALGKKVEKKIGKLTKAKAEANARADDALKRLRHAESVIEKLKSQEVDIDSMSFDERINHGVDTKLAESKANEAIRNATEDYNNSGAEVWNSKLESAGAKYSDFTEVIQNSKIPVRPEVQVAIKESDLGAEMIYHIANNPALGMELHSSSPLRTAVLLQSLEQSLGSNPVLTEQTPAPVVAPTPTLNVAPAPKPATHIANMGMEDFMAMKQKQFKSKRR
jgi:hypothetical protein